MQLQTFCFAIRMTYLREAEFYRQLYSWSVCSSKAGEGGGAGSHRYVGMEGSENEFSTVDTFTGTAICPWVGLMGKAEGAGWTLADPAPSILLNSESRAHSAAPGL